LQEIHWPVWKLSKRPEQINNLVFTVAESFKQDSATYISNYRIIDDKSLVGTTLAERRLQLVKNRTARVYPLKDAVYFLGDFIKLAKSNSWFIDSLGKVFTYKKTTRAKLRFFEIEKIISSGGFGYIVCLKNAMRFKVLYKPHAEHKWAGVLLINKMPVLYGIYEAKYKETWRTV